jgi:prevent-host-death family protein
VPAAPRLRDGGEALLADAVADVLTTAPRDHIIMTMSSRGRRMAAGEFKARCLAVLDDVQLSGREVVITKRGRPVAKVVPIGHAPVVPIADLIVHQGDLVSPIDVEWDAER